MNRRRLQYAHHQLLATPKSRFCGIYVPHGATMDKWTPAQEGVGFGFRVAEAARKISQVNVVANNGAEAKHIIIGGYAALTHGSSLATRKSAAAAKVRLELV